MNKLTKYIHITGFRLISFFIFLSSCTAIMDTGNLENEVKHLRKVNNLLAFYILSSVQTKASGSEGCPGSEVGVLMPSYITAIESCGLICAYQLDYSFSIKNSLSESVSITKLVQEYLSTIQDTSPICSSVWENGKIGTDTCGLMSIQFAGTSPTSAYSMSSQTTIPLAVNNAGYTIKVQYIRNTVTFKKTSGSTGNASCYSPTKYL